MQLTSSYLHASDCILPIEEWQSEIAADVTFRSIFSANRGFMAEDYIAGQEYSFEIIAVDGHSFVVAIHEKVESAKFASCRYVDSCRFQLVGNQILVYSD